LISSIVIQSFFASSVRICSTAAVFSAASATGRATTFGFSGVVGVVSTGVATGTFPHSEAAIFGATFTPACAQTDAIPVGVTGNVGGSILS
jgi:hypothetical protein